MTPAVEHKSLWPRTKIFKGKIIIKNVLTVQASTREGSVESKSLLYLGPVVVRLQMSDVFQVKFTFFELKFCHLFG